jgi:hypothetical protein
LLPAACGVQGVGARSNCCSQPRLTCCPAAPGPPRPQSVKDGRELCVYSISCKEQRNIDITLEWLTRHAKS